MSISPLLLIPSADHSEVFEMKGEFQEKGRKRDIYFSTAPFPCFSLSLIFLMVGLFFSPVCRLLFV